MPHWIKIASAILLAWLVLSAFVALGLGALIQANKDESGDWEE